MGGANLARQPRTERTAVRGIKARVLRYCRLPVVPGSATAFRRARSADHKEQRVRDLLDAARVLAAEQGVRRVTLTAIATRAGVHVSAVRRYFDSREDILLTLAGEGWQQWAGLVAATVQPAPGGHLEPAEALAAPLAELPLFCDLLAHVSLSLEREAPLESVRAFTVMRWPLWRRWPERSPTSRTGSTGARPGSSWGHSPARRIAVAGRAADPAGRRAVPRRSAARTRGGGVRVAADAAGRGLAAGLPLQQGRGPAGQTLAEGDPGRG